MVLARLRKSQEGARGQRGEGPDWRNGNRFPILIVQVPPGSSLDPLSGVSGEFPRSASSVIGEISERKFTWDKELKMPIFGFLGSLFGLMGVALGAFGAHALRARVSAADLAIFETGVRYQMYHALALLFVAWLATRSAGPATSLAGWAFTTGILVFSGSLYVLLLSGQRWLGAVTPIGGVAFLVGWTALAWAFFNN
jgi:uncharacterized membrane protein YgdD (TMEM256/DUF423 family)